MAATAEPLAGAPEERRRRLDSAVQLALLALALLHAASFLGTGPIDDDYIVYRYAANALAGEGLVYNPGERVEGFTCPLWVGAIAAGMALGLDPASWSVALGILANLVVVFVLGRAARREGPLLAVPALLAATSPALAWHAVAGLGTTWLAALLVLWFASALRAEREGRAPWSAALWLGLAGLLRPEAVLFALPWIAFARRRAPVAALSLLPVAAWTAFRLAYYGRLAPVTYDVKKLPLAIDLGYGADYAVFATLQTGVLLLVGLAFLATRRAPVGERPLLRAASAGLALHAAYVVAVGGDYLPLARFFVPALPLAGWLGWRGLRALAPPTLLPAAAAVLVLLPQWTQAERAELAHWDRMHHERWARVGDRLAQAFEPDTSIALSPIGIVGYRSMLPVVDLLGVTNEAVLRAEPDLAIGMKGHHRHDADWVLARRPDVVILGNALFHVDARGEPLPTAMPWERDLAASPELRAGWTPYWLEVPGDDPVLVFLRDGLSRPTGLWPA